MAQSSEPFCLSFPLSPDIWVVSSLMLLRIMVQGFMWTHSFISHGWISKSRINTFWGGDTVYIYKTFGVKSHHITPFMEPARGWRWTRGKGESSSKKQKTKIWAERQLEKNKSTDDAQKHERILGWGQNHGIWGRESERSSLETTPWNKLGTG